MARGGGGVNGTVVREYDATFKRFRKVVFSLVNGTTIELNRGDRVRIQVNEYGNAYIDGQFVGDAEREFEEA
jgi:mRNA degradation ribonuclease J1/J2